MKSAYLVTALTFVTAWPFALIKIHLIVLWKKTFPRPIRMCLHRSTSQCNLRGYHNSHSVTPPPHVAPDRSHWVKVSWVRSLCLLFHCLSKGMSLWFMSAGFNVQGGGCFWSESMAKTQGSRDSQAMICPPVERRWPSFVCQRLGPRRPSKAPFMSI